MDKWSVGVVILHIITGGSFVEFASEYYQVISIFKLLKPYVDEDLLNFIGYLLDENVCEPESYTEHTTFLNQENLILGAILAFRSAIRENGEVQDFASSIRSNYFRR